MKQKQNIILDDQVEMHIESLEQMIAQDEIKNAGSEEISELSQKMVLWEMRLEALERKDKKTFDFDEFQGNNKDILEKLNEAFTKIDQKVDEVEYNKLFKQVN